MLGSLHRGHADRLCGAVIFFFASAGASAAYLTASEVFPMETRALCIAFFYAIGTAVGGITGPLLFGTLIDTRPARTATSPAIAIGYYIGAALMIAGGIVDDFLGVKAEGQSLEDIAQPLTAEDQPADDRVGRTDTEQEHAARCHRPRPTTEGRRDRQVLHEIGQLVRALEAQGPTRPDELREARWAADGGRRAGSTGPSPWRPATDSSTSPTTGSVAAT